ncbi:MAG TPA: phosphotransferase [Candidatus Binatia bacterium]|jgi:5-methylthioribose kinase|nr:phosphotransferase [Candidatus Binatia bacterium]
MRSHPDFPWLDLADVAGIATFLARRRWITDGETVRRCERAGDGNMNLTVRVHTDRRRLVLKQARPWVEKYDDIPAPWDRALAEQRFYARAATLPDVAACMPALLAADEAACTLLLEDIPGARDLTTLYAGDVVTVEEIDVLAAWLRSLHDGTRDVDESFANRAMRTLNHEHCFVVPFASPPAMDLDRFEPGLGAVAARLANDVDLRARVDTLGRRYLAHGQCLVHADYFPGSWLRSDVGLRIIDPEFAFPGDPEVDVGCALAHLALARQPRASSERVLASYGAADLRLVAGYAAVEIMRRLLGVAQLPLPPSEGARAILIERAQRALHDADVEAFWS